MAEPQPINVIDMQRAATEGDSTPSPAKKSQPQRKKNEEPTTEEILASINRALPFSDDAEKGVISCILQDPVERLSVCRTELAPECFYHVANRTVYEEMIRFYDRNIPLDLATLTHSLREKELLDKVGGAGAISELFTFIPGTAHYEFYKKVLIDKHLLREVIHACSLNINDAYEHGRENIDEDIAPMLDRGEQRLLAVREGSGKTDGIKTMSAHIDDAIDFIEQMIANPGQLRGVSTGYAQLDRLCAGLQGGEMFVIAARPSMGKTSLAMNIVEHIAVEQNVPVAVFSLEMSASSLVQRLLVSRAGINMSSLKRGMLSRADQDALSDAIRDLQNAQIFIDETPGIDIMELKAKCRRLHRQYGIKMVAIDYLQLLTSSSRRAKDNRQIEIAEISGGIKAIAKELNVPVIVLAQLNRSVEQRKGQRPMLSDLRESGSIEQDADMVGLLTRADYAGSKQPDEEDDKRGGKGKTKDPEPEEDEANKGKALLIIAKNRNGPTDDVHLTFIDHAMRFIERKPDEPPVE
ncbi:MAG: replicative DNA helicase [Verrucomicrobiaceae bacterium]|nr:replicative DNA helicase [Verrucomicrobiaceae bacterium]